MRIYGKEASLYLRQTIEISGFKKGWSMMCRLHSIEFQDSRKPFEITLTCL